MTSGVLERADECVGEQVALSDEMSSERASEGIDNREYEMQDGRDGEYRYSEYGWDEKEK